MKALDIPGMATVCAAMLAGAQNAHAQGRIVPAPQPRSVEVRAVPGPQYEAGMLRRVLLGSGWRDLWLEPLDLPVLDLERFAGGLDPLREGGNAQSVTLHFVDADGRRWIFRSVDKYPSQRLADGLDGTLAGYVIQDQISSHHPAGALVIPPLLDSLGILHVQPALWIMPDDPRLGDFRDRFAGMIGMLEEKPADGPGSAPGFAGALRILDTSDLLEQLEADPLHRVAQHELLRARLIDFIIGDTDRTEDNYDWAGFPDPTDAGRRIWRPIPRDRDWAFIRANGMLARLFSRTAMAKLTRFERDHAPLSAHTSSGYTVDRRLLTGLDRGAFEREVARVRARLSDSVIDAAVKRLSHYPESHGQHIAEVMKLRRDNLASIADEFYAWLAREVDVHASDGPEHVEIVRNADGTVEISVTPDPRVISSGANGSRNGSGGMDAPSYHRIFRPAETKEIRIFLHGGDDVAVVRGDGAGITIRVIGGGGDDVLADSSSAPGTVLYDGRGDNRLVAGRYTTTDTRDRHSPATSRGTGSRNDWGRDWGEESAIGARVDHIESVGLVFGAGPTWTAYAFRRVPHQWRASAFVLTDTRLSPGVRLLADYRFEGVSTSIELDARWSKFDAIRWFGPGNQSERVGGDTSIVRLDRVSVESSIVRRFGAWHRDAEQAKMLLEVDPVPQPLHGSLSIGPTLRHTTAEAPAGSPWAADTTTGSGAVWQIGALARAELRHADRQAIPRRGYGVRASLEGFPGLTSERGPSGSATAELNAYVPLIGDGPHLAFRAGGTRVWGEFPAWDAASVGGRRSLRGYSARRFAGDAAAFGGAELRVPVGKLPWIAPGEVGVFGLLDAGRVWSRTESAGGWHTGRGIGLWVMAFRQVTSIAYVRGERSKLYAWLGMPF